jgi:hypothetical protein
MPQEYVAIVGNAPNVPPQAYLAVVDASGNVISGSYGPPGGRLTLASGGPVLTAPVAASAVVYYTPYQNDLVPIYNGTTWLMTQFTELTNTLANSAVGSAGPAAVVANSNYDLFVWNNAGVITLTRGPLWTSDTARNLAIVPVNGIQVNLLAITNGPAAGRGTYVGTVRGDSGGGTVSMIFGSTASGGGPAVLNVWNCYNRRPTIFQVVNSDAAWTYASGTVRAAAGSATMRASYVRGLNEDAVIASWTCRMQSPAVAATTFTIGIGTDSTVSLGSVFVTGEPGVAGVQIQTPVATLNSFGGGLGAHFLTPTEQGDGVNTWTVGANGVNLFQGTLMC